MDQSPFSVQRLQDPRPAAAGDPPPPRTHPLLMVDPDKSDLPVTPLSAEPATAPGPDMVQHAPLTPMPHLRREGIPGDPLRARRQGLWPIPVGSARCTRRPQPQARRRPGQHRPASAQHRRPSGRASGAARSAPHPQPAHGYPAAAQPERGLHRHADGAGNSTAMNPVEIEEAGWPACCTTSVSSGSRARSPRNRGELNKAEQNFLNMHPQYGLEMLSQCRPSSPGSRGGPSASRAPRWQRLSPLPSGRQDPSLARLIGPGGSLRRVPSPPQRPPARGAEQGHRPALQAVTEEVRSGSGQVADKGAGVIRPAPWCASTTTTRWPWCCRPSPPHPSNPRYSPLHQGAAPGGVAVIDLRGRCAKHCGHPQAGGAG